MSAPYYDPVTGRCPHGVRAPHECRDGCEDAALPQTAPMTPERAPMQGCHGPGTISWAEHIEIFEAYAKRYGREQSAERIAERGGFGFDEAKLFTGKLPQTWQAR